MQSWSRAGTRQLDPGTPAIDGLLKTRSSQLWEGCTNSAITNPALTENCALSEPQLGPPDQWCPRSRLKLFGAGSRFTPPATGVSPVNHQTALAGGTDLDEAETARLPAPNRTALFVRVIGSPTYGIICSRPHRSEDR